MKIKYLSFIGLLLAAQHLWAAEGIPTFASQQAAQAEAQAATPKTPEEWLMRMTDFTRNASAYKDPQVFLPWVNAVTEPGFYPVMGQGIMDPAGWLNMMNSMTHPNAYRNWAQFADPAVGMRWLAAGMDPAYYTALLTQLSDPGKMMRWAMLPMDPKMWALMMNMFNPNLYMKWGTGAMDPRTWTLMGNMMNPATYMGFMGAMMDPKSYGPSWGNWLSYAPTAPEIMSNPAGSTTAGAGGYNLINPNAGAGIYPQPQATNAAPAVALAPDVATPAETVKPAQVAKLEVAPKEADVAAKVVEAAPQRVEEAPGSKMVLSADALFKLGKSGIRDLTPAGKQALDDVAAKIKALGDVEQINIVGHADASGKAAVNMTLSEARARSVKSYLVAKGVKPGVIITSGVGDTQPIVQCDMGQPSKALAECLAPNRRVEIEVVAKAK